MRELSTSITSWWLPHTTDMKTVHGVTALKIDTTRTDYLLIFTEYPPPPHRQVSGMGIVALGQTSYDCEYLFSLIPDLQHILHLENAHLPRLPPNSDKRHFHN